MASVLSPSASFVGAAKRIYIPVALLMTAIALVGFWPTYFGPLLAGTVKKVPVIHLHAAVYSGWLILVITQATLAATGRIALHRKVGRFGMGYGVVVIVIGVVTAFSQFASRVEAGNLEEAQRRLFAPLTDMIVFAPLLGAAWAYRHKPEIHKRLIIVASTVLLVAAVHRMTFLGGRPPPLPQLLLVWLSPIYTAMAYDFFKRRLVHPVYLIGIATVLLLKARGPLARTEAWRDLSNWFASFYV